MREDPIRLRDLHVVLLMRLYLRGGAMVAESGLSEELGARKSPAEIRATLDGLVSVGLAITEGSKDHLLVTLTADGQRNARMWLDAAALSDRHLLAPKASAARLLDYFEHQGPGSRRPSRWQRFKLSLKWWFRRDWKPD